MLRAVAYDGGRWSEVSDFGSVSELRSSRQLVWAQADVGDLSPENIARIAEELGLHPLAVEDALTPRQRPKLENYDNHLFAVMHQLDTVDDQLEARQIACFVGDDFVLAIHDRSERTVSEAMSRCARLTQDGPRGPSVVMQALLDAIVDEYQQIADRLEEQIEMLEDVALARPRSQLQGRLYVVKQQLARLRRYVVPGEKVLLSVVDERNRLVSPQTSAHFRDIHDHLLRIIDQIRNVDDLTSALVELLRAEQSNALNEVTKRLTGWAAIIAIPTLIASIYGMNFRLFPQDGEAFGFWFALGLMGAAGMSLYLYFKRKEWL